MALIARVVGLAVLAAWVGAAVGRSLYGSSHEGALPAFCLACVGAVVGAIAGATREIVAAQGQKHLG